MPMPMMGMGGPLGGPMGGPPPNLASPETMAGPPSPEARTVMASPLAARMGGPLMAQQQQSQLANAARMIRQGLQLIASQLKDQDPRRAATLEQWAAKLLTMFPGGQAPTTPGGIASAAQRLPMSPGGMSPAAFPPPAAGPSPMSGMF